ncbi:MAG: YlmC/YmxH family sporulation protein [Pygmaiobacter sp.]
MITLCELCERDIINVRTGTNLGRVDDLCVDEQTATVTELVIYGRWRFFGLFGKEEDVHIPWSDIVTVGEDVVLVRTILPERTKKQRNPIKL